MEGPMERGKRAKRLLKLEKGISKSDNEDEEWTPDMERNKRLKGIYTIYCDLIYMSISNYYCYQNYCHIFFIHLPGSKKEI